MPDQPEPAKEEPGSATCEAIDAAVQQKLSQEYLVFIASSVLAPYIRIESSSVVRYGIEEIDANSSTITVSDSTEREGQSLPLLLSTGSAPRV